MHDGYHDPVPNPDRFTPQRPIRVPDDTWEAYGATVGERERSADIKAYIAWRTTHPNASLPAEPGVQLVDFFVRVRLAADSRQVEVIPIPGPDTKAVGELRAEIVAAIVEHFRAQKPAKPRGRPKKTT